MSVRMQPNAERICRNGNNEDCGNLHTKVAGIIFD